MKLSILRAASGCALLVCASAVGWLLPAAQGALFQGTVTDADGTPIAGAAVTRYVFAVSMQRSQFALRRKETVKTGEDGVFRFAAPAIEPVEGVHLGSLIVARKDGLALGWTNWDDHKAAKSDTVQLLAPKSMAGVVVDEEGAAIPDAEVRLGIVAVPGQPVPKFLVGLAPSPLFVTRTDAEGRFRFGELPPAASAAICVNKPGKGAINTIDLQSFGTGKLTYEAGREDIRLEMARESRIKGVVTDSAGKGVPRAQVMASHGTNPMPFTALEPALTDDDGTFEFGQLTAGQYTLTISPGENDRRNLSTGGVSVTVGKAEIRGGVVLKVGQNGTLHVVVAEPDGTPVEGATVAVVAGLRQSWQRKQTDGAGKVTFELPAGKARIQMVSKPPQINMYDVGEVEIGAAVTTTRKVEVKGTPKVAGVLRDTDGKPVAGASVRVLPNGREDGTSGEDGAFLARWDERAWGHRKPAMVLVARHPERGLAAARDLPLKDEDRGGITMGRGIAFDGHVVDENGDPIAGARASVLLRKDGWGSGIPGAQATSDAEGRYRIDVLPPGQNYSVSLSATGYGTASVTAEGDEMVVTVPEAALRLANLSITGKAVNDEGEPVADAQISAYGRGQPHRNTRTAADGTFRIEGVCAGDMTLHGYRHSQPFLNGTAQTEGGATGVRLVMLPPGSRSRVSSPSVSVPHAKLGQDFDREKAHHWSDFQEEGAALDEWSRKDVFECADTGRRILGRFANDPVEMTVKDLPEHQSVRVYFELYALASWDGHGRYWGPDVWLARVRNGPRLVGSSFSNESGRQSYPLPFRLGEATGGTGGERLSFGIPSADGRTWSTHVVYPMCFAFAHTDAELTLQFTGIGLQEIGDESWGIDNVGIELLDTPPWKELDADAQAVAWENLGSRDVAKALSAMNRLASAGDQTTAFVQEKLGWQADPALREELGELIEILKHSDWYQWREASEDAKALDPRLRPLVDSLVDARRFESDRPPWIDEFFNPKEIPEVRDAASLRTGRAARVLERIWTDRAREALLLK